MDTALRNSSLVRYQGTRRRLSLALRLAAVLGCTAAVAAANPLAAQTSAAPAPVTHTLALHLDPEKTSIDWTVGALLGKLHGNFKLNGGAVIADPKSGLAQGEIEIDAGSGAVQSGKSSDGKPSADAARTAKWQKDVLNSSTYPAIIFHPTTVEGLKEGDGEQMVHTKGTVTLAGGDHPLELTIQLSVHGSDVVATTRFQVPYVKWGLNNPSSGFTRYDKEVTVEIHAQGTLQEQTARPTPAPAADSK